MAKFEVGVDSGQAGIFDVDHYKDDSVFGNKKPKFERSTLDESGNKWYAFCCDATLYTKYTAGVIPYGAVSSSGFGDGGYPCIYWTDESGEIVKVAIGFIFDEEADGVEFDDNEYEILVNNKGEHTCSLHDNHNKPLTTEWCEENCGMYSGCDTIAWANDEHKLLNGEAWRCKCGAICNLEEDCDQC
jgi:hypothetical protein